MNAIAAHKNELERLLVTLSRDAAVSGIGFVVLLDAYIARLDVKLFSHQRERRYGVGANKQRIDMEPTLTQNCALYYAQHTTPERRSALFRKFRVAAREEAPSVRWSITRAELSKRALYRDNGR
jgi:hypothetical protein